MDGPIQLLHLMEPTLPMSPVWPSLDRLRLPQTTHSSLQPCWSRLTSIMVLLLRCKMGLGSYLDALRAEATHVYNEREVGYVYPASAACLLGSGDVLGAITGSAA